MANTELERLRSEIQNDRRKRRGPFSPTLRSQLIEFIVKEKATGRSAQSISEELGVSSKTVSIWLRPQRPKLRKVRVVKETPTRAQKVFSLRGPAETILEGVTLEEVASLWRVLGC